MGDHNLGLDGNANNKPNKKRLNANRNKDKLDEDDFDENSISQQFDEIVTRKKKGLYYRLTFLPQIILGFIYLFYARAGISADEVQVELLIRSGFNENIAGIFVIFIGLVSAVVSLALFFLPRRSIIIYACFWPTLPNTLHYVDSGSFNLPQVLLITTLAGMTYYFRYIHFDKLQKRLL